MKIIVTSAFILICSLAKCQEFWLHPNKFNYEVGEELKVIFLKGDNFVGEPLSDKTPYEKIELLQLSKQTALPAPSEKSIIKTNLNQEGTYQLSVFCNGKVIEKSAEIFNTNLKSLALDEVLNTRTKTNSLNKSVRENLTVFSKLVIQSGSKSNDAFKKRTGARLEIIPQQNPTILKSGDYLQCLILFNGKPLPHQLVKIWNRIGNASILQNAYTENDGVIKFPISSKGPWMISTITMIPSEKPDADWQSFQSTLTFGIE